MINILYSRLENIIIIIASSSSSSSLSLFSGLRCVLFLVNGKTGYLAFPLPLRGRRRQFYRGSNLRFSAQPLFRHVSTIIGHILCSISPSTAYRGAFGFHDCSGLRSLRRREDCNGRETKITAESEYCYLCII